MTGKFIKELIYPTYLLTKFVLHVNQDKTYNVTITLNIYIL